MTFAWLYVDWMAALPWLLLPRQFAAYDVFIQTLCRLLAILRRLIPHPPNLFGSLRLPWTRRWLGRLIDEAQATGMLPLSFGPGCPPIHTRGPRCAPFSATWRWAKRLSQFLEAYMSTRLIALDRDDPEKVRPLGLGNLFRKLINRAKARMLAPAVSEALAPLQYAIGHQTTGEALHKTVQADLDLRPNACLLVFDVSNAFNEFDRMATSGSCQGASPAYPSVDLS